MPFLSFSNIDVEFVEKPEKLTQKFYIAAEALPTTSQIEFINKRKFVKAASDANLETFVVNMSALNTIKGIYPSQATQIAAL